MPMMDSANRIGSDRIDPHSTIQPQEDTVTEETVTRTAVVTGGYRDHDQIRAYLPDNYQLVDRGADMSPFVQGKDVAGWTLDGYVIPRLASGLIWAEEITP
jgi:hypothetical protein